MAYRFQDLAQQIKEANPQDGAVKTSASADTGGQTAFNGQQAASTKSNFQSGKAILNANKDVYNAGSTTSNDINNQISGQINQQTNSLQQDANSYGEGLKAKNNVAQVDSTALKGGEAAAFENAKKGLAQQYELPDEFKIKQDPNNIVQKAESGRAVTDFLGQSGQGNYGAGASSLDRALFTRGTGFGSLLDSVRGAQGQFNAARDGAAKTYDYDAVKAAERGEYDAGQKGIKDSILTAATGIDGDIDSTTKQVLNQYGAGSEDYRGVTIDAPTSIMGGIRPEGAKYSGIYAPTAQQQIEAYIDAELAANPQSYNEFSMDGGRTKGINKADIMKSLNISNPGWDGNGSVDGLSKFIKKTAIPTGARAVSASQAKTFNDLKALLGEAGGLSESSIDSPFSIDDAAVMNELARYRQGIQGANSSNFAAAAGQPSADPKEQRESNTAKQQESKEIATKEFADRMKAPREQPDKETQDKRNKEREKNSV